MAEIEKELRHYLEGDVEPRAALEWSRETRAAMVDLKFCDLLGTWQHVTLPIGSFDESAFDEGLGFDGSSIRGWQGIEESDMILMPDASTAILDPFTEVPTLSLLCEIAEPVTLRAVREGSAPGREARGGVSALDRHRRHVLRRPRVRVLRLRRGLVHERPERGALQGRLGRGSLELRRPRSRLHDPREAGLLPARAARHAERPAHAHGADARAARRAVRVPPSRGRVGGPVRDRPALREPDAHGGSGAALQVRDQEHGARRRQVGDVHAEADLRRQRLRHALPPVAVEGRHAALRRQVRARRALAARARRTSPACSSTRRRCSRSARRRRTRTAGSCRATRRRSTSRTRRATAARASASRPTASRRRRSASSSAAPTRPRTRTSRSRRC